MEDTLKLTTDPGNSFDVLSRLGAGFDRLGKSGEGIAGGFLKSENRVGRVAGNMARQLASVSSAGEAAGVAIEGIERATAHLGLGTTVGFAILATGAVTVATQIAKTAEASKNLGKELSKTFSAQTRLSVADLAVEIQAVGKSSEELEKDTRGVLAFFARQFTAGPMSPIKGMGSTMSAGAFQQQQIQESFQREMRLREASADAEERIVSIKNTQLEQGKDAAALAKLQVDYANQIAKIQLTMPFGPPTAAAQKQLDTAQKLLTVESALLGIETSRAKQSKILSQQQDTAKQATDFFTDLGSGKFAQDFAQKQRTDFQQQAGRDLAKRIEEGQEKGFFKDPLSQAALKEAQRISDRAGTSVTDLANTDFSNLLELSKFDFSGLQPLNGLTLQIQ